MRILQINNFHYPRGGSDRYFLDITALLRAHGHEVATFSSQSSRNIREEWLVVPPVPGVDTDAYPGSGQVAAFLYSTQAKSAMQEAIRVFRPDVAHLHIYYGQLTASILAPLRKAGVPVVQTLHEYKTVCPTDGLMAHGRYCDSCQGRHYWRAVQKRCNRGSLARSTLSALEAYTSEFLGARSAIRRFIAVSGYQKSQLVKLGLPEAKMDVIPHFAKPEAHRGTGQGGYFLFVGRLAEGKGMRCLLDALALLGGEAPTLHVVGTGPEEGRLREYAARLGVSEHLVWRGFRTGDDLDAEYRECLALVNPSTLNETFGLTALEALARGRPVIVSDRGALPEIVRDGRDGFVFKSGDAQDLAGKMRLLLTDAGQREAMAQAGFARAQLDFSPEEHLKKVMSIYETISLWSKWSSSSAKTASNQEREGK